MATVKPPRPPIIVKAEARSMPLMSLIKATAVRTVIQAIALMVIIAVKTLLISIFRLCWQFIGYGKDWSPALLCIVLGVVSYAFPAGRATVGYDFKTDSGAKLSYACFGDMG